MGSQRINKKIQISDPILAYCYHRFDTNAFDKIPLVKEFISEIEKNIGQKILLFQEGGSYSNGPYDHGVTHFPRRVFISELKSPGYDISKTYFGAIVKNVKEFSESEGWRNGHSYKMCHLNDFLDEYAFSNKSLTEKKSEDLKGLEVIVPNPHYGSSYNSDIKEKLIIGNERVDNFLKTQDFLKSKTA